MFIYSFWTSFAKMKNEIHHLINASNKASNIACPYPPQHTPIHTHPHTQPDHTTHPHTQDHTNLQKSLFSSEGNKKKWTYILVKILKVIASFWRLTSLYRRPVSQCSDIPQIYIIIIIETNAQTKERLW